MFYFSDHHLHTLFYETVREEDKYITVVLVKKSLKINSFEDLKGRKACFPVYDGIAWNSVVQVLNKEKLLNTCPYTKAMAEFFGDSCVPNVPEQYRGTLGKGCTSEGYQDDYGAIKCLNNGGEVAFVSRNSFKKFLNG